MGGFVEWFEDNSVLMDFKMMANQQFTNVITDDTAMKDMDYLTIWT